MTDDDKKRLTEWLGECWHEPRGASMSWNHGPSLQECRKCKADVTPYEFGGPNRTFTTPDDFFACFNRLVELGEWEKFYWVAWGIWLDRETEDLCGDEGFTQWILSRTESGHYRLCVLVSEWPAAQKEGLK